MHAEQTFLGQNSSDRPALSSDILSMSNQACQLISSINVAGQLYDLLASYVGDTAPITHKNPPQQECI